MRRQALEVRVGLVVVLASVILVVGTMWFQKFQLSEKRYPVYVTFVEVGGLVSGDPVYINGVERGRVANVYLHPDNVVVALGIEEGVGLPRDSRIVLKSVGIMGERFVAITQGSGTPAAPGDTLSGEFLAGLSEVMGAAGTIVDEIAETSRNLREVVEMLTAEGRLQVTMENVAETSEHLREFSREATPRLIRVVESFERVAAMFDSLATKHEAGLDSTMVAAEKASADLAAAAEDLRQITERLQAGEGSLGRLLSDEELINRLESAVSGLDSLIMDIKLHPGRYVTFRIF